MLGRPIAGRPPVQAPESFRAPENATVKTSEQPGPEPLRPVSYDNPPSLVPPSLAPLPAESALSSQNGEDEPPQPPEILRKPPRPLANSKRTTTSAKPAAFQAPAPAAPEKLPQAIQEPIESVPGGPGAGEFEGIPEMGMDCGCCGWLDYPAGMRGPLGQWWVSAEYLRWKVREARTPPLVTAGPLADPRGGVLGDPATQILFGGAISFNWQNGFRVGLGYWFDESQTLGLEGSFFYLVQQINKFTAGPTPGTFVGRPFFDVAPGLNGEAAEEVAGTNLTGSVTVKLSTKLLGGELNLRTNLGSDVWPDGWSYHVDGLVGFRFLQLQESLSIVENLVVLVPAGALNPGDGLAVMDEFKTRNSFYGGQIGLDGELRWGRWFLNVRGKVAFGVTHQLVTIDGQTMFFQPAGNLVATQPGGLLALPTNMGGHTRTVFSVVPEVGLNLGYQLTEHWRIFAGYTVLYWSHVARPGQQIDRVINSNQLPSIAGPGGLGGGPARPMLSIRDTSFWVQGLNLGAELTW
jgi:hypothetical protein